MNDNYSFTRPGPSFHPAWRQWLRAWVFVFVCLGLEVLSARAQGWGHWKQVPMVSLAAYTNGFVGGEGAQEIKCMDMSSDGNVFVLCTDVGGVWISTNGGDLYQPSKRGLIARGGSAVAIDPNNSSRILIEACKAGAPNQGLFMTTNAGLSWTQVLTNNAGGGPQWNIAYDPSSSDGTKSTNVYWSAPYSGDHQYDSTGSPSDEAGPGGLWRSTDGGVTWTKVNTDNTYGDGFLAVHPTSGRLYVARQTGFYYSTNQGVTFTQTSGGQINGMSVSKSSPNYVALVSNYSVYISTNSGSTFTPLTTSGLPSSSTNQLYTAIRVSPLTTNNLMLGTQQKNNSDVDFFYSTNGGLNWAQSHYDYLTNTMFVPTNWNVIRWPGPGLPVWSPVQTNVVFNMVQSFIVKSTNAGANVFWWNNGFTSFGSKDAIFNFFNSNTIIIPGQDWGGGFSTNGGASWIWPQWPSIHGNSRGGYGFNNTNIFLDNGTNWDSVDKLWNTPDGGKTWNNASGTPGNSFIAPVSSYGNPVNSNGAFWNYFWTTNQGVTWTIMGSNGAPFINGVLTHNADPTGSNELYGVDNTAVYVSTNQGKNLANGTSGWQKLVTIGTNINELAYDWKNARIYIASGFDTGGQLYQYQGGVLSNITSRLPVDPIDPRNGTNGVKQCSCVAVDPVDPSIVYAGRSDNFYSVGAAVMCSTNSGTNWFILSPQVGSTDLDGGGLQAYRLRVNPFTRELWVTTASSGTWHYSAPGSVQLPTVTISATTPNASVSPETNGVFTVTRDSFTTTNLVVNYTMSGTATNGTDYTNLSGSVTITAGNSTATITVGPKTDTNASGTLTAIATLSTSTNYNIGSPDHDTVNIAEPAGSTNLSTVTIAATTPNASESPVTNGVFTVTRTSPTTTNLVVNYTLCGDAINGTDYTTLSGSVTINGGSATATITVAPLSDVNALGTLTVVASVSASANYTVGSPSSDIVYIAEPGWSNYFTEFFLTSNSVASHGWAGNGNLSNSNLYSFTNSHDSSWCDAIAGEAGGIIARTTPNTYYADTNLGATFTLANALHANGEFVIVSSTNINNSIGIGFLNHANAGGSLRENTLALTLQEPATSNYYRAKSAFALNDGTDLESAALNLTNANSSYKFILDYNPNTGVNSQGRLSVQLFDNTGTAIGTINEDLTAANRTTGASFDSFGLFSGGIGTPQTTNLITLFIDNTSYTVTNGTTAYRGIGPTLALSAYISNSDGLVHVNAQGWPNVTYRLQVSTDLSNWSDVASTNTPAGKADFIDTAAGGSLTRFYRGVTEP